MEEYRDDKKSKLYYMDEILHKISSMSQAENEKQLDDITLSILKSVGKYTAADRAYIFEWSSEKKESFKNTFEWCASGIEPQIQNLQKVPVCLIQNWVETFIQKKNIISVFFHITFPQFIIISRLSSCYLRMLQLGNNNFFCFLFDICPVIWEVSVKT